MWWMWLHFTFQIWSSIIYLAASRSFIDKFVVGSSDLMALLLLFKWLVWLWWLLLLRLLLPSLPLWWCTIALSDVLWPTDVVIDVIFKSVMRSTVFSDSYVTARQKSNEINYSMEKENWEWEKYWELDCPNLDSIENLYFSINCCIRICAHMQSNLVQIISQFTVHRNAYELGTSACVWPKFICTCMASIAKN